MFLKTIQFYLYFQHFYKSIWSNSLVKLVNHFLYASNIFPICLKLLNHRLGLDLISDIANETT